MRIIRQSHVKQRLRFSKCPLERLAGRAKTKNISWLEFLNKNTLYLMIVDIYVTSKRVEDGFDDIVYISLHLFIWKIEQGRCDPSFSSRFTPGHPSISYPRLPSSFCLSSPGLKRDRCSGDKKFD